MSRSDPQCKTGVADYPPPALPCVCSDLEGVHEVKRDGSRGRCRTVTRWAQAGRIGSIRTPGGHRRYRESEVRALLEGATPDGAS